MSKDSVPRVTGALQGASLERTLTCSGRWRLDDRGPSVHIATEVEYSGVKSQPGTVAPNCIS